KLEGWFDLANQWDGTIQRVNSKYTEGDTIALRFYAPLTAGSKHTVLLKYDFGTSGPGPHFFDSLGAFDATIHNADPVAGISGAGSPTVWTNPPITIDPTLPDKAQIAWQLTTYNVFSNSVNSVSFGPYTVVNNGPGAATSVVVTDALPAGTTFVSETHSQGTLTSSSPLTFSLGTINAGASATNQITVKVDATAGSISNTATVSAATVDPVSANNITTKAVTINDTTPPTIQCPSNVMKGTDAGQCSAVVTFTVQVSDNSPGTVSVVCNPASGSTFQVGPTLVTCTATDAALNSSMCTFTVTVNDTERPHIDPPADIIQPQCAGVVVNYATLHVTGNCPGAT